MELWLAVVYVMFKSRLYRILAHAVKFLWKIQGRLITIKPRGSHDEVFISSMLSHLKGQKQSFLMLDPGIYAIEGEIVAEGVSNVTVIGGTYSGRKLTLEEVIDWYRKRS